MRFLRNISSLLLFALLFSCQKKERTTGFSFLRASETGIDFNNELVESDFINFYQNEYMYIGSGVGVADFNNDGLTDVIFGGSQVNSRVYLNKGNFKFEDITETSGIGKTEWVTGVSILDINQDGWQDIYLCVSHFNDPQKRKNLLFVNQRGESPTFEEQAEQYGLADTGFSTQAAFFDYDQDGDLDMYLLNHKLFEPQPNRLVRIDTTGDATSADKLYRNNYPEKNFTDISNVAGIKEDGYGLGVVISDFNRDNLPDVYVANDYLSNDYFWQNTGQGTFKNILTEATRHNSFSSMGLDATDLDNDLHTDLIVLDMMPNTNERKKMMVLGFTPEKFDMQRQLGYTQQFSRNMLQLNQGIMENGKPLFSEIGNLAGIAETDWSWSVLMADFDNDSDKDIHISNGLGRDLTNNDFIAFTQESQQTEYNFGGGGSAEVDESQVKQWVEKLNEYGAVQKTNFLFQNNGTLQFEDISQTAGITQKSVSHGAAYADFDNDGDLDLVVNNMNQPAFVMRNETRKSVTDSTANFLRVKLNDAAPNHDALGAKVLLSSNGKHQILENYPIRGYASSVENILHFGLGNTNKIDSIKVLWPDGAVQKLIDIEANQVLVIEKNNAGKEQNFYPEEKTKPLFEEVNLLNFKHQERPFFDYYLRRMQPQKYSQLGPCLAKGDFNGDGLEDIFVGGAAYQSASVFLQNRNSTFEEVKLPSKPDEDLKALVFDAEGDGDQDILVVGGSTEYRRGQPSKPRLYRNDGKANFTQDETTFPADLNIFSSTLAANDIDRDGDLDLFIGGRIDPQNYPAIPQSYVLKNEGGRFSLFNNLPESLQKAGMVTDAIWADIDQEEGDELILCGEWMPLRVYQYSKTGFTEISDQFCLQNTEGMWRKLAAEDVDGDGDLDLIAGNYGENNKYHTSPERPYHLFSKDLDQNGLTELLPAYYIKNNEGKYQLFPDFDRHQIADQTPLIKKNYLLHKDFASATMEQLLETLGKENLQDLVCKSSETVWFENKGSFEKKTFPMAAQMAPVNALLFEDFNADGKIDLLLAGNEYQTEVSTGRIDASFGQLLTMSNSGSFIAEKPLKTGIILDGDTRDLCLLKLADGSRLLVAAINDEKLKTYKTK